MKEYYVDWINKDKDQIEGRKPHNGIRSDGELTEAETVEEAAENIRQWIFDQFAGRTDENGNYYEWEAEETDDGDIRIWDIGGENKKLIAAYLDFRAKDGNYYEWKAEETDDGDIIIWDIGGEERKLIAGYFDLRARENAE